MGLDMFVATIRADLVTDQDQVDIPVGQIALKAVGFTEVNDDELMNMTEDGRAEYFDGRRTNNERAVEQGLVNHEFAYWRKFNNLHGWMERLYRIKGGSDEFNCTTVRLTKADLDNLEKAAPSLEPTQGFFFGSYEPMSKEDVEEVRSFVAKARAAIDDGQAVYYSAWY